MIRRALAVMAATAAMLTPAATPASAAALGFSDDFTRSTPLGSFANCNHNVDTPVAYCAGLAGWYRDNWWAYPGGWPDTARQRGYPVGGMYDPARTVWVDDGQMHIRLFRNAVGLVHSAAVVPKSTVGVRYGMFSERFRVSRIARGYKSAHLLWPMSGDCHGCEVNFPENEWNGTIHAFTHPKGGGEQEAKDTRIDWSQWHTSTIEWTPGRIRYFLDGRIVGESTEEIPDRPMMWVLQNESALNGDQAAPGSWAQMDIEWVRASW
jgi:Glycosyl hydrolases family 16